jgi:hypothetical protein
MASTTTLRHRESRQKSRTKIQDRQGFAINYAVRLIHAVCGLAGSPTLIDEIQADLRADQVRAAIRNRHTGPLFDWLMAAVSYQGRFVQHAIWQYCSLSSLDVCNGNRIDDSRRCENKDCRVRLMCDRVPLRKGAVG